MMNKFLDKLAQGQTILFSELLEEIPADETLLKLFPRKHVTHCGMEVLKLRVERLRQPEITERLNITSGKVTYASTHIMNVLRFDIPPYIDIDVPALRSLLRLPQKTYRLHTPVHLLVLSISDDTFNSKIFGPYAATPWVA